MTAGEPIEIALFPIPNVVTFPHATIPLHVFEPRYRKMVKDCLQHNRRIGVCHVIETLHKAEKKDNLQDKLNSNQDPYEPQPIFSAGFCTLKETTEDGRLLIEIQMEGRYQLQGRIQEVPYQVYQCTPYLDQGTDIEKAKKRRAAIDQFLLKFAAQNATPDMQAIVEASPWQDLPLEEYSFQLFNTLQFDAEISQTLLEMRSSADRLDFACKILNIGAD
jgi:Lon protease-like protein